KGIGSVILLLLNIFVKLIGILILLIAGTTLIGLFIGLFTVGTFGLFDAPWADYIELAAIGAPLWVLSLLTFFAIGIPFFFLFILGLKILVKNLKSIGTPAKLVLLGLWLLSVIGLSVLGIQHATARAFDGEVVLTEPLPVTPQDTLYLSMQSNPQYSSEVYRGDVKITYDENDNKIMYSNNVRLVVKSTKDSVGRMEIVKLAEGSDSRDARNRAENIDYNASYDNGKLFLDSFLTSDIKNNFRDQEVRITLFLPEGSTLYADRNISSFHRGSDYYGNILKYNSYENYLQITNNGYICEDCETEDSEDWETDEWENDDWDNDSREEEEDTTNFLEVREDSVKIESDRDGSRVNDATSKQVRINRNGISIQKS